MPDPTTAKAPSLANPPKKPLVIYDGDCGFCRYCILRWEQLTHDRVDYRPLQDSTTTERFPEVEASSLEASVHFLDTDGQVYQGAEAVFRTYAAGGIQLPLTCCRKIPGFRSITELGYTLVARNRMGVSWLTRLLAGPLNEIPEFQVTAMFFLRSLALIFLVAFGSLLVQVEGLYGESGILPIHDYLTRVTAVLDSQNITWDRFRLVPTLFWCGASTTALKVTAIAGMGCSLALLLGLYPGPMVFLLWTLYLSFVSVGQSFLSFQWDTLLLETAFLSMFLFPWSICPKPLRSPSLLGLWLLRFLLFKLMFASGSVKLLSQDTLWHNLTALSVHYQTQPLPTMLGWYAHQLPLFFHQASCVVMFAIELLLPFLMLGPRRLRLWAFFPNVALQVVILITGNYGFFNWLTLALCLTLLDDTTLKSILGKVRWTIISTPSNRPSKREYFYPGTVRLVFAVTILLSSFQLVRTFRINPSWLRPIEQMQTWLIPFRSNNIYGLFAVMTPHRPEITIQGSRDGETWQDYVFKHKPGPTNRMPSIIAPHQPRLDWQMWFAALGSCDRNPWFVNLCIRLLENNSSVTRLLQYNPFADTPPKYIRAVLHTYEFTDLATKTSLGTWWQRKDETLYMPPIFLSESDEPSATGRSQ
ncbi:MAG: hypothetical protein M2R45_02658 [Verrucomicrobia subdivision 3 bacterium]|nr:hypothetical protein [Limisphaerales bacterium]MCS1414035.1 hypothetical protein [Limisphaerales bacterium]